ncbi:MAG: site-specific integrase [Acidobacteria bacterium]|nr:site-specific integrase [Acidobacteriota bacterium]
MGSVYRPKDRAVWWISYSRGGKRYAESSESTRKKDATTLLQLREGDIAHGKPVTPQIGKLTFGEAAADLLNDYRTNGKRSLVVVERRVTKHLTPYFGGRRMADITTSDARAYIAHRQQQGVVHHRTHERIGDVSNAEINRELALLKRMFSLAVQDGKLLHRPHIPMLDEDNVRVGFFEAEQLASVLSYLPAEVQPVIRFAAVTGWRIASEVLPLEWRNVDFAAGEVRLDAGTTKNREARVFPFTSNLRAVLEQQHAVHLRLKRVGRIVPFVFFRLVAHGRGGEKEPRRIIAFGKAWKSACRAAGCPGRIPHDLRRTAIRAMVRRGVPERVAMMLSGHKTRSVFERYNIVSHGDLRDAARKLDAPASQSAAR